MTSANELSFESLKNAVKVDEEKWNRMPSAEEILETAKAVEARGINVIIAQDRLEALERIQELVPKGAEVMNGSSTTLIEIGFGELLKAGKTGWKNLHEEILSEKELKKGEELRRKSVAAEYFLSGVNAIAKTGELVSCDASGSRVGAWLFGAKNLILVAGVNKIANSLQEAMERVEKFAYPLENERAKRAYGFNSMLGKMAILHNEIFKGRTTLILVKEKLGF